MKLFRKNAFSKCFWNK